MNRKSNIVPCKVGTQPWLVVRDERQTLAIGKKIRLKGYERGEKWFDVIVTSIDPFRVEML